MHKVSTIEIRNFKSLKHAVIKDCRKINIFIGYPNVGKSNILEALSIFSIDSINQKFSSFVRIENLTTLFYNGDISKQSEIKINGKHRMVINLNKEVASFVQQCEIDGTSFEKNDNQNIFLDDTADVLAYKIFGISENTDQISYFKSENIGNKNKLCDIRKYEFIKRSQYSTDGYLELLVPNGNNVFNILSTNEILRKEVEELFKPYNLELLFDARQQKFTILKRTSTGIFSIPYDLVADTLQRLIFYKTAIHSNKEKILLFEEPEAQMFPPFVRKFTTDIVFDETNQFFITTHSPYVITEFIQEKQNDLAVYVVDYDQGETIIKRLTDEQVMEVGQFGIDLFFNLESYLDRYGQSHSA